MPYLIIVTALWAFSFSLIGEYLAGKVDSDFAVLLRVLVAAALFLPFTTWRGLPRRLLGGFWLAGALQFGVTYLCLYRSFHVLTVAEVLLFTVLTPIYVTLLDDALSRRLNPWALLAAVVAVGGGIIIRFQPLQGAYLTGFLLLQLANLTFAAGQVLCRRLLQQYPTTVPLHRLFGHFFLGALLLASMLWHAGQGQWLLRELLVTLFIFVTAPVSAQMMAMAALHLRLATEAPLPDDLDLH